MTTGLDAALDAVAGPTAPPAPKPAPPGVAAAVPEGPGLHTVRVELIDPNPQNPRERMTDITDLAHSIQEAGLIQPPIVRRTAEGRLELVAGHRRLEAVKRLGWFHVEVVIRKDMAADDVLVKALVENGQRAGLDPIEEARGFARLKALGGLTDAQVAKKVGRNQPLVSGRIALLALPPSQQEEIRAGQMHLVEAVYQARLTSGKLKPQGPRRHWHLGPDHALAPLAKARCQRLGHPRSITTGGVACGACWESVIRADERAGLHEHAAKRGECPICSAPTAPKEA